MPVPAFSTLPSLLPLYGEAALTSWWSWVAAGCLGLRSSIDVWLFVLADSPKTSSMRQREREKHSGEDGGSKEVCIKIKELIAVSCAKISYMHI